MWNDIWCALNAFWLGVRVKRQEARQDKLDRENDEIWAYGVRCRSRWENFDKVMWTIWRETPQ